MILKKRSLLKLLLACSVALIQQSCSSDEEGTEQQMEVSQDDSEEPAEVTEGESEEGAEQEASESEETASEESADGEAVAYDAGAEPTADSEVEKSLDEVLDETLATDSGAAAPVETAPMAESDTNVSMPAWESTAADDVTTASTDTAARDIVASNSPAAAPTGNNWAAGSSGVASSDSMEYVVQPGDTVSLVSKRIFGDISRWQDIAATSQLSNPNRIFPGDLLRIPSDAASQLYFSSAQSQPKTTVTVQAGDTLSKLAEQHLGSASGWATIWKQNQDKIKNPDMIFVGQTFAFQGMDGGATSH